METAGPSTRPGRPRWPNHPLHRRDRRAERHMFVDTTALREQVIDDVLSAFGSAGQLQPWPALRCRPRTRPMSLVAGITGAMDVRWSSATRRTLLLDVGPVIDVDAKAALEAHPAAGEASRRRCTRSRPGGGTFFGPVLAEIPTAELLTREVFGLDPARRALRPRGSGQRRLSWPVGGTARRWASTPASRPSPTRSAPWSRPATPTSTVRLVGAVVGVQPFRRPGTGLKAGGPTALSRPPSSASSASTSPPSRAWRPPALLNLQLLRSITSVVARSQSERAAL